MHITDNIRAMASHIWTVAQAKAELSEILRRARADGPQRIGTRNPCVVISEQDWQRLSDPAPALGDWLLEHMAGFEEIELPSRQDPPREIPFEDE